MHQDKTLYDYWMVCYRRRLTILVLVSTAVAGALLISASLPPVYEARAMFYVPSSATTQRSNTGDTAIPLPASNQDDAKANIGILKGRDALRAMAQRFPARSTDALQRDVDFTAGRDGIIQVYVRDRDPARAAAIANAYPQYFNDFLGARMQQRSEPKFQALRARITEVAAQLLALGVGRRQLATLTSSALDGQALELVKNREALLKELDDLKGAIAARSASRSRGERLRVAASPVIDEIERQLDEIDLDLAKLRVRTLPNHPDQVALVARRAVAQTALLLKLDELNARDAARAEIVTGMLASRDRRVKAIPDHQNRLAEIDQQLADLRAAMSFLKNSLEELLLASTRSPQVGIVIESAELPAVPVFPIAWLNAVVAALVASLVGILYALLLEYIDESVGRRAR